MKIRNQILKAIFLFLVLFFYHCQERELTTSSNPLEQKVLDLTIVGFDKTNFQTESRNFDNIFSLNREIRFSSYLEVENNPLTKVTLAKRE